MKQILFIAALMIALTLISSCKATPEKTIASPSSAGTVFPSAKEKDALRLLGRSAVMEGPNLLNDDGSSKPDSAKSAACFRAVSDEVDKDLAKDIADYLHEVAKTFAEKCPQTITLWARNGPVIQQIRDILGNEEGSQKEVIHWPGTAPRREVTWYKFDWLEFGAANDGELKGKVVVLRVHTEKVK